jgi:hypothetical protein
MESLEAVSVNVSVSDDNDNNNDNNNGNNNGNQNNVIYTNENNNNNLNNVNSSIIINRNINFFFIGNINNGNLLKRKQNSFDSSFSSKSKSESDLQLFNYKKRYRENLLNYYITHSFDDDNIDNFKNRINKSEVIIFSDINMDNLHNYNNYSVFKYLLKINILNLRFLNMDIIENDEYVFSLAKTMFETLFYNKNMMISLKDNLTLLKNLFVYNCTNDIFNMHFAYFNIKNTITISHEINQKNFITTNIVNFKEFDKIYNIMLCFLKYNDHNNKIINSIENLIKKVKTPDHFNSCLLK